MKILVTGCSGYIGTKVSNRLFQLGHHVIATDIRKSERLNPNIEFIQGNIFNISNAYKYFKEPDILLHLAWRNGFLHNDDSHIIDLPKHFEFINSFTNTNINKVVVMGSMHEIGYHEGVIDDNTQCNPSSKYGISKNALRQLFLNTTFTFNKIWLRAFYIYGDDFNNNSIFSKIMESENKGILNFPVNSGVNKYDFLHINDLVSQIINSTIQNEYFGIINCCSGKAVSLKDKLEEFKIENNLKIMFDYGAYPSRKYDSPIIYGDSTKIKNILKSTKDISILITGSKGQVGYEIGNKLEIAQYSNITKIDIDDLDLRDFEQLSDLFNKVKPEVIFHCAAYTAVDKAETDELNCYSSNVDATKNIAKLAKIFESKIIFLSTDYVFDGSKEGIYEIDDVYQPLSVYGRSKMMAEKILLDYEKSFIVRTSWVYGKGNNFIKKIIELSNSNLAINVINDQFGSLTNAKDLALFLINLMETKRYGIYHATNEGFVNWFEIASFVFDYLDIKCKINPVNSENFLSAAKRPKNSRLNKKSLTNNGFDKLPNWKNSLVQYLDKEYRS